MIYFVSHGQTFDNANGNLLNGWSDTPLSEVVFNQAKATALELKNIKVFIKNKADTIGEINGN